MSTTKPVTKKEYLFKLSGLNLSKIHKFYNLIPINKVITEEIQELDYTQGTQANTTLLSNLPSEKRQTEMVSYLDESKKMHKCDISMIDINLGDISLFKYHCFWCKNPFNWKPIGCPVKYIPNQAVKTYYSHISKDTYRIKEDITDYKRDTIKVEKTVLDNLIEHFDDKTETQIIPSIEITVNNCEHYETDGIFCSFNCCKSWIDDNKHNKLYDMSDILLVQMYNHLMETNINNIKPAPHWRLLDQYGGYMNIIKFRDSFNKIDIEYHGISRIKCIPLSTLWESKVRF